MVSHKDWFRRFFREKERGTARDICNYLVEHNVQFNCSPDRRIVSVRSSLNKECQRRGGFIDRVKNEGGVYEYLENKK